MRSRLRIAGPRLLLALAYFLSLLAFHGLRGSHDAILIDERSFGYEIGHVAKSAYLGEGFSFRVRGPHGVTRSAEPGGFENLAIYDPNDERDPKERIAVPTSLVAPLYASVLVVLFHGFGLMTPAAAWAAIVLNCAFQATAFFLFQGLSARLLRGRARSVALVFFVLQPAGWVYTGLVWSQNLYNLEVLALLVLALSPARLGLRGALGLGALAATVLLTDKSGLPLVAGIAAFRLYVQGWTEIRPLALAAALASLLLLPWAVRNYRAVETFTPFNNTSGILQFMGNSPTAHLTYYNSLAASFFYQTGEMKRYAAMGEKRYNDFCRSRSMDWIMEHPTDFVRATGARFVLFWGHSYSYGLVRGEGTLALLAEYDWITVYHFFWRVLVFVLLPFGLFSVLRDGGNRRPWLLLGGLLLVYPLVYYVFIATGRYVTVLDPILCLTGARAVAGSRV